MSNKSELDQWEANSKNATALLGTLLTLAVGAVIKMASTANDQNARRLASEERLRNAQSRFFKNKKEIKEAQEEYDKYH